MSSGNLTRLLLTVGVLSWAFLNLFPMNDRELGTFLVEEAGANQEELSALVEEARATVETTEESSFYLALRELANQRGIDLTTFYPEIEATGIPNLRERNAALMREMLRASRSKLRLGLDLAGGVAFKLKIAESELVGKSAREKAELIAQVSTIMNERINGLGVSEPMIRPVSGDTVEIQLPGENIRENPEVVNQLRKPARLEFRLVSREPYREGVRPPLGYETLYMEQETDEGQIYEEPLWVRRLPEATGVIVDRAQATISPTGTYQVVMSFTGEGSGVFADITGRIAEENTPNSLGRLAIVLDGKLYSAPTVRERIRGGAEITGRFSQREASELSNVLNNPLATELELSDLTEVGPSLAADARIKSVEAGIFGIGVVALFMLAYYGAGGVVALLSVAANLLIVIGILASLGATLTLPGVAALVLTVGMAVDANILILERIREELRVGKSLPNALGAGFEKVFSTIVDANVTTLLTALILVVLGTGPVKGFGLTLAIGIGASVFCALVLTRLLLESAVFKLGLKKVLLLNFFPETSIDFLKYWKPAFIGSWILVAFGIGTVAFKGKDILGIDFLGGDEILVAYEENPGIAAIDEAAAAAGFSGVQATVQTDLTGGDPRLKIQTPSEMGEEVFAALVAAFPESGFSLDGQTTIGASVSAEITRLAILSVGVGLVAMLLYVAFRFEIGFGVGALVATIHDVLMSVGLFVLFGGEFSAPMIAAVLMIMGYSINDTIVAFDRMREELALHPEWNLRRVVNYSINRVLSRTIMTSATTFGASLLLWIFAAGVIQDFALVFLIGVVTGTFSSIFIASPVFYRWHRGERKRVDSAEAAPSYEWETGASA